MKNILLQLSCIIPLVFFPSCKDAKTSDYSNQSEVKKTKTYTANNHPGKKLIEAKCYVCHNPSTDHDSRIAPPMVAIKSHYLNDDTTKEDFSNSLWNFVEKPSKEKSKMRGAVRRFGVMPYQQFSQKDIRLIADYLYDFKIDEPEWFKQHIEEESNGKMQYRNNGKDTDGNDDDSGNASVKSSLQYSQPKEERSSKAESKKDAAIGIEYILNTKKELGKDLMDTIQKKGIMAAVTFCNKQVYPITDSMAVAQNASIKRVSDKPRTPQNIVSKKELEIIAQFKKAIANNEDYMPVTEVVDSKVHFYTPITTKSMCLQCHGTPEKNIKPNVLKTIADLYQKDMATGYAINGVHGIWGITYDE